MTESKTETAVFGGGCFWCTEALFEELRGVISVISGYAGGSSTNLEQVGLPQAKPTYDDVCTGKTGHAEVIKVEFDPSQISYEDLLTVFFATHDPTTVNRQGADIGTQYRSIVLYTSEEQKQAVEKFIATLNDSGPRVVTEVKPLDTFYEAEDYHRGYYRANTEQSYCQVVINPKLKKLKEKFNNLLNSHEQQ